jgi:hypothetical protein
MKKPADYRCIANRAILRKRRKTGPYEFVPNKFVQVLPFVALSKALSSFSQLRHEFTLGLQTMTTKADPARLHDLHMVQSVLALSDHLAVFERGIANRLDFAFAGPQSPGWRIATRERIALAVAIGFPAVAATHGRSSVTWRSVMKVLITALALVTLIASLTFAQRQYPGEFYPASYQSPATLITGPAFTQSAAAARKARRDACQSGPHEYCDYPDTYWHCWDDVRCSAG